MQYKSHGWRIGILDSVHKVPVSLTPSLTRRPFWSRGDQTDGPGTPAQMLDGRHRRTRRNSQNTEGFSFRKSLQKSEISNHISKRWITGLCSWSSVWDSTWPMQGHRQVQSLVQEDSTWHRANKPMHHNYSCVYNYRVCSLDPKSHHDWAHVPQLLKPLSPRAHALQQEKSLRWEACTLQTK